jgi:membrane protease YdiL (CAAX protease family)
MQLGDLINNRWLKSSAVFAAIFLLSAAYLNYRFTNAFELGPVAIIAACILWISAYLPAVALPLLAGWNDKHVGFRLGWNAVLISIGFIAFLVLFPQTRLLGWSKVTTEAFARTGEEVFFRGFLFTLIWRLAEKKPRPWVWAIVGSSLAFMIVHTQTFQPGGILEHGVFQVVSRLINLFVFSAILSYVRWRTDSVLPGAVVHSTFNGGLATIPFVVVLYLIGWAWCKVCGLNKAEDALAGDGAA